MPFARKPSYPPPATDAFTAMGQVRQPLWVFDIDRARVHWANASALAIWNANSLEELCSRDMSRDMSPAVTKRLLQYQSDFDRQPGVSFSEVWTLYPKGQPVSLECVFSGYRLPDGRMAMLCESLAVHHADPDVLRSTEALTHTSVMITLYDRDGYALYRNPSARTAAPESGLVHRERFVVPEEHEALEAQLDKQGEGRTVARVRTSQGVRWHEITARTCRDAVTGKEALLVSEVDVDDLKTTEARAQYLAHHDELTGLPNRTYVARRFQDRLDEVRARGEQAALVHIDLDHFKNVNDALGHAVGDELLVHVASRLRQVLRAEDLLARLGGDEFLVLAASTDVLDHVTVLADRLVRSLTRAANVGNTQVRVTPTMGVSVFPRDGGDIETLMRHADMAMFRAKANGRNGVAFFTQDLDQKARSRISLENDLRVALEERQFVVYYQPRVDARTNRVCGAESLVRWRHPSRGMVMPGEFIPVCEESGLVGALGELVLEQAARQQAAWKASGHDLKISVNLSPRQLADPKLLESMRALVVATECDPTRLELEITESVLLGNDDRTMSVLESLRTLGFSISIDDFGTGYSNLAYLEKYPIDALKIDRAFVSALDRASPIAELIVTMCQMLRLKTVAEGVETEQQLSWLREKGCFEYQGYLFSPAVPPAAFEKFLVVPP
jgi:diguanylate cyclase (GGDEF)-like protein